MPSIAPLQGSAVLQAVPPSELNIAMPHEEEEEWVAVTGGGFERCVLNAAARGVSSASRTIAKKRRSRKAAVCNNMPCALKGTPHDGLCTHMVVFGKRGGRCPSMRTAARRARTRPAKQTASDELSPYELQRQENVRANNEHLESLGLGELALGSASRFDLNDTSSEDEADDPPHGLTAGAGPVVQLAPPASPASEMEAAASETEAVVQVAEDSEPAAVPIALYSSNEIDALRRIRDACSNIILQGLA